MKKPVQLPPMQTDMRNFRLNRIREPQYRHLWLLLFWPVYGIRYLLIENWHPAKEYHLIHCALDDLIPFHEIFLIPYALWYVCLIGLHLYTALYDVESFRKYTKFLVISMSISTAIFFLYPSYQSLRPEVLPRENILSKLVKLIYMVDTNTNIFPSEHAIGAGAIFAATLHTKGLHSPVKTTVCGLLMLLVALSTVFLKQHSILDVAAAVPICLFAYWLTYGKRRQKK